MDKSFANGNGQVMSNGPSTTDWARELMIRDPSSWTLTGWETPA